MKNRQVFRPVDFLYANPSVSLTLNNKGAKYKMHLLGCILSNLETSML